MEKWRPTMKIWWTNRKNNRRRYILDYSVLRVTKNIDSKLCHFIQDNYFLFFCVRNTLQIVENQLTLDQAGKGLSLLCKTANGLSHAYVRLDVREKYVVPMTPVYASL